MPTPATIVNMHQSAFNCRNVALTVNNPKAHADWKGQITRTFHCYLELTMQCKHDAVIRGYCQQIHVVDRRAQDTQIHHRAIPDPPPPNKTRSPTGLEVLAGYYAQRGNTAADIAMRDMVRRWGLQPVPLPNAPRPKLFTAGVRVDAPVQRTLQADNHYYDLSYWVEPDGVWVLFHCYPA